MAVSKKYWIDLGERVGWTIAETLAATAVVELPNWDVPGWAIPLIAAGLSALKGLAARQLGNPDSASTARSV